MRQLAYLCATYLYYFRATNVSDVCLLPCRACLCSGYLATDSVLWLQYARFLRLTPKKVVDISTLSNRLWLAGIVFSLASSGAGMVRVRREARRSGLVRGEKDAETKGLIACVFPKDPSSRFSLPSTSSADHLPSFVLPSRGRRLQPARPARLADAPRWARPLYPGQ
jgi:hypothetical protein